MTAQPAIRVRVNGSERVLPAETAVAALVDGPDAVAAAIARNNELVPRAAWPVTLLADGDEIEILRPVQGGAA